MVGTSKILTVSYGTFSCTLEGFDDSFNTMKAIAEYFRGLASDDRYFGAEPPTPDAEMLAKIAEREISRRVDARMDDGEIVLRAAALSDQSADDAAPEVSQDTSEDEAAAQADADADAKAARKAQKAAEKAARKAAKAEAKAAKEAEEQAARDAAEADAEAAAQAQAAEDLAAQDLAAQSDDAADDTSILDSVSTATAAPSEGTTGTEVEETRDDAPSSMLAAPDPAPETQPAQTDVPAHPDSESVAAKLQRIRAVVGKSDDVEADTASSDLTEQFLPQSEAPDVADAEVETPDAAEGGSDMISRVMARHSDDAPAAEATPEPAPEAAPEQPRARVVRMKRADFEKAEAEAKAREEEAAAPVVSTGPDFGLLDGADELDDYLEDSDFVEADTGADIDLDLDLADDLKAIQDDAPNDEGDVTTDTIANVLAAQAPEETQENVAEEPSDFESEDLQVDDAALDRLMSESDAQMQEPEGSRRRDAIAQLKAAVAAKEAARQVGEPDDDGQDVENAFRNDLSEVVDPEGAAAPRPRPVVRNATRTERPRPAPLKLVAAQRVDLPQTVQRDTPVIPRRVSAQPTEAQAQAAGSFAEFAENMDAKELPDLLEAAAAYTSFVEGADEFSRPQILRRVRAVASDDFNREDGLRSFADLLRAGRFTKVRNGRFQVAGDSRFNPEQRAG